jgi:hypothetical protein
MEVNKRYLIKKIVGGMLTLTVVEVLCLQISPSGKYVRVHYVTGDLSDEWLESEQVRVLEPLPPRSS